MAKYMVLGRNSIHTNVENTVIGAKRKTRQLAQFLNEDFLEGLVMSEYNHCLTTPGGKWSIV